MGRKVRNKLKSLKKILWRRRSVYVLAIVVAVLVAINLVLWFSFKKRTYPNTWVGSKKISSVSYTKITQTTSQKQVLPQNVQFEYNSKTVTKTPEDLGVIIDDAAIQKQAQTSRSWLPLYNLLKAHKIPVYVSIDEAKFTDTFNSFSPEYQQPTEDARLQIIDGTFSIKDPQDGQTLQADKTKQALIAGLEKGVTSVKLPVEIQKPNVTKASLEEPLKALQNQQNTSITLSYQGKTRKATPQEVANWYASEGTGFTPADTKIQAYIASAGSAFGIRVQNLTDVTAKIKAALKSSTPLDTGLVAAPIARKSYSYCLAAKGVETSQLNSLNTKLISVFSDPRGWGLDGLVNLTKVDSGCTFTVWLSAAPLMSTFGEICDSDWSCRVGSNVVINFDRWQGASAAWNAAGGSLDEYRSMVINHETGHWFGFYHAFCAGAGQAAPVMQQQSISLQGCTFNAWPLASERAALKSKLGI